jgi:cell division protein FtsB
MKGLSWGVLFFVLAGMTAPVAVFGQGASLDVRALREDYRRIQSQLEDLLAAHNALKKEMGQLRSELRRVRATSAERDPNTVTREDLESLAKSIREVDRKRVGDKELILKEIRSLISKAPAVGNKPKPPKVSAKPEKYFEHEVISGEVISTIVAAFNAQLKKRGDKKMITTKSVLNANPGLDPTKMPVGRILIIPDPSLK